MPNASSASSASLTEAIPHPSHTQLGFDFDATALSTLTSPVTSLVTSLVTGPAATPLAAVGKDTTEETPLVDTFPPLFVDPLLWRAPPRANTSEHGMDALAMACSIQNAELASALMELPERWDFNAPHKLDFGFSPGFPSALTHLLYSRYTNYSSENMESPGFDLITSTALAMVERGADFLQLTDSGLTPITLCAMSRREEFFEHLVGHPRFTYALMSHLRIGERLQSSVTDTGTPEPDHRMALLGYLISRNQLRATEALVVHAGFAVNTCDANGRLPIGYCKTLSALETLIKLGALPGMDDRHGRNALARIQLITDTDTRDKMITRVAKELKKGAKSNPSIMATLQSQNIAALLEAAQNAPKSSLLKTINAFDFDVSQVRDPKTLITPLMAACKGGRMASAQHLLAAGSDINAVDAQGVPASAYLLSGHQGSNGPDCSDIAAAQAHRIDFSLCSTRGFPVALEAAFMMGNKSSHRHGVSDVTTALKKSLALSTGPDKTSYVCGPDGLSLMESYISGRMNTRNHYHHTHILASLLDISTNYGVPDSLDRALLSILTIYSASNNIFDRYNSSYSFFNALEQKIVSTQPLCVHTARFIRTKKEVSLALATAKPQLYAHIEKSALTLTCEPQAVVVRPRNRL